MPDDEGLRDDGLRNGVSPLPGVLKPSKGAKMVKQIPKDDAKPVAKAVAKDAAKPVAKAVKVAKVAKAPAKAVAKKK